MTTIVSHQVPTTQQQAIADLTGYEDAATLRWPQVCVQAAQLVQEQYTAKGLVVEPARLARGLDLTQRSQISTDDDDGSHTVTSGKRHYTFRHGHVCPCEDRSRHQIPCKHELAVAIHLAALKIFQASAPLSPPTPELATNASLRPVAPTAAQWPTNEAPASMNVKLRVGSMEQ